MRDIVLDIKGLTRRFDSFTAVDDITLSVNAAEWPLPSWQPLNYRG